MHGSCTRGKPGSRGHMICSASLGLSHIGPRAAGQDRLCDSGAHSRKLAPYSPTFASAVNVLALTVYSQSFPNWVSTQARKGV